MCCNSRFSAANLRYILVKKALTLSALPITCTCRCLWGMVLGLTVWPTIEISLRYEVLRISRWETHEGTTKIEHHKTDFPRSEFKAPINDGEKCSHLIRWTTTRRVRLPKTKTLLCWTVWHFSAHGNRKTSHVYFHAWISAKRWNTY